MFRGCRVVADAFVMVLDDRDQLVAPLVLRIHRQVDRLRRSSFPLVHLYLVLPAAGARDNNGSAICLEIVLEVAHDLFGWLVWVGALCGGGFAPPLHLLAQRERHCSRGGDVLVVLGNAYFGGGEAHRGDVSGNRASAWASIPVDVGG